jgi:DNA invertase Pin-like site-specific DNA recombinase
MGHGDTGTDATEKPCAERKPQSRLNRVLGKLAPGDTATVTRIDRLARSTFDLFGIARRHGF